MLNIVIFRLVVLLGRFIRFCVVCSGVKVVCWFVLWFLRLKRLVILSVVCVLEGVVSVSLLFMVMFRLLVRFMLMSRLFGLRWVLLCMILFGRGMMWK